MKRIMLSISIIILTLASGVAQAAPGAKVTWTAGTETDLAGYKICRSDTGTSYTIIADIQTSPTVQVRYAEPGDLPRLDTKRRVVGLTDTALVRGRWYYYAVVAYDRAGNTSPGSLAAVWIPGIKQPATVRGEAIP